MTDITARKGKNMAKLKIGVFGCRRGGNYVSLMASRPDDIEVVALCDREIEKLGAKDTVPDARCFTDFDEFLTWGRENGMQAVFLANYFHQHAPFAIKCMEAGMDVVSECTSASTLRECVELVECVERTGRKYMIAENYPFSTRNLEMKRIVDSGALGSVLYAQGEYNHGGTGDSVRNEAQGEFHWRAWLPKTYYNTHALGPLMYMTDSMPLYVSARAAHSDYLYAYREYRHAYDGAAYMFCEMDNGMVAVCTGCTAAASDYSRYRIVGDDAGIEGGGHTEGVRMFWHTYTKPANEEERIKHITPDLASMGEKAARAAGSGHGGGDWWIVDNMLEYFVNGVEPFFNVYRGVAMSAVAILGWKSCLNHGENFRIPNFRSLKERDLVRDDDLTPFPGDNGEPHTMPSSVPFSDRPYKKGCPDTINR